MDRRAESDRRVKQETAVHRAIPEPLEAAVKLELRERQDVLDRAVRLVSVVTQDSRVHRAYRANQASRATLGPVVSRAYREQPDTQAQLEAPEQREAAASGARPVPSDRRGESGCKVRSGRRVRGAARDSKDCRVSDRKSVV